RPKQQGPELVPLYWALVHCEANGCQRGQTVASVSKDERKHIQSPIGDFRSVDLQWALCCRPADSHPVCCMTPTSHTLRLSVRRLGCGPRCSCCASGENAGAYVRRK